MAWTRRRLEVPAITGDPSILLAAGLPRTPDGFHGLAKRLRVIVLGGLMEKEYPPSVLLEKLDRDQDRALFGLPSRSPRRRS